VLLLRTEVSSGKARKLSKSVYGTEPSGERRESRGKERPRKPSLTPKQTYKKACSCYVKRKYEVAISLFQNNSQYWIRESYYDQGDFTNGILALKQVAKNYADRSKAPDALLKIGYTYLALDDLTNARLFLKER